MIFLAQTDTTAGFLSKNPQELNKIKNRPLNTPCIITLSKLKELKTFTRVPKNYKNFVRRAKKTTILYKNLQAIRVIKDCKHSEFLDKNGFMYSTSANLHNEKFNLEFAKNMADCIVDNDFFENKPSVILKISNKKIKKIR